MIQTCPHGGSHNETVSAPAEGFRARVLAIVAMLFASPALAQADPPHLQRRSEATQLIVDGEPFLILGGELGNSEASSHKNMREHWPKLRAMNFRLYRY